MFGFGVQLAVTYLPAPSVVLYAQLATSGACPPPSLNALPHVPSHSRS
jgi:hypothetical protein